MDNRSYRVRVSDLEEMLNKKSDTISTKDISRLFFDDEESVIIKTDDVNGTDMIITDELTLKDFNMTYKYGNI